MKLIQQSFEILEQTDFSLVGIKKFIERCGRVCYKSEDRITDTSYERFVGMLESRDHARPLEFGTVHLKMNVSDFNKIRSTLCLNKIYNDQWIKHYYVGVSVIYVTTNYRYYLNILKIFPKVEKFFTKEDNEYYPRRYTVHFIINRGIMDEFRTHVSLSHLAESTRYCNYDKDKFGNELTFVAPCNLDFQELKLYGPHHTVIRNQSAESIFISHLNNAEKDYLDLIKLGRTPQQAREVLPLSVKSELISCGFADAWENFFYRRCAKDAHPMAREIAIPLQEKFKELGYIENKINDEK